MKKIAPLVLCSILVLLCPPSRADDSSDPYPLSLPPGIQPPAVPADNPLTKGKVALGKKLYFDRRLSLDNSESCATCHNPGRGFADGKNVAEGIKGRKGARNSPTTLNAAYYDLQFWDGRAATLEDQAKGPMVNPVEMGMPSHELIIDKLKGIKEYDRMFSKVFGVKTYTIDHVVRAIASFERTLITYDSPFDRFVAGDTKAISASAQRGWGLFLGKAQCNVCHTFVPTRPFFSDNKFHNIGVSTRHPEFAGLIAKAVKTADPASLAGEPGVSELGRFMVTKKREDIGAFKTSQLRDIALTAPYMHDGSEATLEAVVEFYNTGAAPNTYLDKNIKPLGLTRAEVSDLVEFLTSLTTARAGVLHKELAAEMK